MSLPDTIFIFGLALVIFGPKKLPEMGRQMGKLLYEFRRASNEFKAQIEEELRAADEADHNKNPTLEPGEENGEEGSIPAATVTSTDNPDDFPRQSDAGDSESGSYEEPADAVGSGEGAETDSEEDWNGDNGEWDDYKDYGDDEGEHVDGEHGGEYGEQDGKSATLADGEREDRDWDRYSPYAEEADESAALPSADRAEEPFQWESSVEPETEPQVQSQDEVGMEPEAEFDLSSDSADQNLDQDSAAAEHETPHSFIEPEHASDPQPSSLSQPSIESSGQSLELSPEQAEQVEQTEQTEQTEQPEAQVAHHHG